MKLVMQRGLDIISRAERAVEFLLALLETALRAPALKERPLQCSAQSPRTLRRSLGAQVHPWRRTSLICRPPLSLPRHPAAGSVTSVSLNAHGAAVTLYSSILRMCSIFLYAKYVEAVNT